MLRPCTPEEFSSVNNDGETGTNLLTSTDRLSRTFVVSRFWAENEEHDIHMFWISGSESLEDESSQVPTYAVGFRDYCAPFLQSPRTRHLDVLHVQLTMAHDGIRGPARYRPVSSVGTLDSGEDYFIYRFVLYWDGLCRQASRQPEMVICLNLPLAARESPSAVHVLTLTPLGVAAAGIPNDIFADIVKGMTTGFIDYDADGNRRRIFLDLVAFLGDTPAINSFLDVLGNTSTACCHLCRFLRGATTLVGSRYAVGHSHGMVSHSMRTFFQHTAVRDSSANAETCRLLGMRFNLSATTKTVLQLRKDMFNARHNIPITTTGQPVVPHVMDPYRACLVAPDHLLTGHLRDCIALALRLLPSDFYRTSCEKFMMGFLEDASLPVQNRLVDQKKKSLFSMSMSDLYSLSAVVDAAFFTGCQYASGTSCSVPLTAKCQEALGLVRSCTKLISELWYYPHVRKDGRNSVKKFKYMHGCTRIRHLQQITDDHLNAIVRVCHMSDSEVLLLQSRENRSFRRSCASA